jgi:dienelactone hydrolase
MPIGRKETSMLESLVILAGLSLGAAPPPAQDEVYRNQARALVLALTREDFAAASRDFDAAMQKALPEEKLREMWKDLISKVGPFSRIRSVRIDTVDRYRVVVLVCQFEKATLETRVAFDQAGKVAGLNSRAQRPKIDFQPPEYARPDSYEERPLTVGTDWPLPGTLTVPKGKGPFPVVVLVHGSGPHDRDETIAANKPFRDLAWGLASREVAVYRYEKRTLAHGGRTRKDAKSITVDQEVLEDAGLAVAALAKEKDLDPKRIFVVGHSLGAHVAPVIAQRNEQVAGIVLLAGNTRPLEDLIQEQISGMIAQRGKPGEKDEEYLARLKKQVARAKERDLPDDTPVEDLPLRIPAVYLKSLRALDVVEAARKLDRPILVLQGERDYQVTLADFAGWKKALADRPRARLKTYPDLNHLFIAGKGKSTPEEYERPGHVAREVIDDIAAWIEGR